MNCITGIILGALTTDFILNFVADFLNLKNLKGALPPAFQKLYDQARYRKSQAYLRVNTRFGWLSSGFNLIIMLVFWFGKGFPALDAWIRSFGWGTLLTGLLFIGALLLAYAVLNQPFALYRIFVIEERFGFNQTTGKTYFLDLLKGGLLSILLGGPILAGILAFFEYAGTAAWVYCWLAVVRVLRWTKFQRQPRCPP